MAQYTFDEKLKFVPIMAWGCQEMSENWNGTEDHGLEFEFGLN